MSYQMSYEPIAFAWVYACFGRFGPLVEHAMARVGLVRWTLLCQSIAAWLLGWPWHVDAKGRRMSGCEGLTGNPRTDRALVALARLLGEISSTASTTDAQLDSRISAAKPRAQPLTAKVTGRHAKARTPATRYRHGASAPLWPQPNRTLNMRWEGNK